MFLPLILAMGVFWWISSRSQKKERQKAQNMLNAIKRNDRIQTIGGILGTVVDVRDNEVIVKVDEGSNVKMRFMRSAIKEVMSDSSGAAPASSSSPPSKT
jgi:preprotein translocase subunit YajC